MKLSNIDRKQWADYADQSPNATFYHHPLWFAIWDELFGWKSKAVTPMDNPNLVIPFLFRKRVRNKFSEMRSGPAGVYGGQFSISSDAQSIDLGEFLKKYSFAQVVDNPHFPITTNKSAHKTLHTFFLNLQDQDFEKIIAAWSDSHKRTLKKIQGYTFSTAKNDDDWSAYYALYQSSIQRWGDAASNNYPKSLFDRIRQLPKEKRTLYLVKKEDTLCSGAIVFANNGRYDYWHGAASEAGLSAGSSLWLQYKIIEHLKSINAKSYDLGPSGNHQGVEEFKRRMGATRIFVRVYSKQPFWAKLFGS